MDSFDGLGGGLRSRRRRTAAARAAVFFLAVLVTARVRGFVRVLFFLVAFFANSHLRAEPMHVDAGRDSMTLEIPCQQLSGLTSGNQSGREGDDRSILFALESDLYLVS